MDSPDPSRAPDALLTRTARALWNAVWVGTWAVLGFLLFLFLLEESGALAHLTRSAIREELGPVGEGLEIGEVRLAWFEPGIRLEDVRFRAPRHGRAGGEELLRFKRIDISLSLDLSHPTPIRKVHVDGGRVIVSERLLDGIHNLSQTFSVDRPTAPSLGSWLDLTPPSLLVTGFSVGLVLPDRTSVELGSVDLVASPDSRGDLRLNGRLYPRLAGAIRGPAVVHVTGTQHGPRLEWSASAVDVPVATEDFELPGFLGDILIEQFQGRLTVDSFARVELGEESAVEGWIRAAVDDARLLPRGQEEWIEELSVGLDAQFEPREANALWERSSWSSVARVHANYYGSPFNAWAEFGREVPDDAWVRVWCRAEELGIDERLLTAFGVTDREVWDAFAPRGTIDTSLEFLGRPGRTPGTWDRELAVHLRPREGTGLTYRGFPDARGELQGFPLPIDEFSGETWITWDDRRRRPLRAAGFGLVGRATSGHVSGWGQYTSALTPGETPEFDLFLEARGVTMDESLARAMGGNPATRLVWNDYSPKDGLVDADWRLHAGADTGGFTGWGRVQVHGASLAWRELPVPLQDVEGQLSFVWGRHPTPLADGETWRTFGVEYAFRNDRTDHPGARARLSGFAREEPIFPGTRRDRIPKAWVQDLQVEIDQLLLKGSDFDILADAFPALREQVEALGAVGRIGVRYYGTRPHPELPFRSEIEAWPDEVEVTPRFFQKRVSDVHGRVGIQTWVDGEGDVRTESVVSFLGSWPGGVELGGRGTIPDRNPALLRVFGAGIDPADPALRGAFLQAMSEGDEGEPALAIDLSGQRLFGPIDLAATSTFLPDSDQPPENAYRIFLRDNELENDRVRLTGLHGVFNQTHGVFSSDLLEGRFGGRPLRLQDVSLFPLARARHLETADPLLRRSGFWSDPAGFALQADLYMEGFPLDGSGLGDMVSPETRAVLDDAERFRGHLTIPGARVIVTWELDDAGKVALHGPVRPYGVAIGNTLEIPFAELDLEEFVLEEGRVRGYGTVSGLDAVLAGHQLEDAEMIVGFVDKRLTIDNLFGRFEGGNISSLGGQGFGSRKALGVDLASPHRFDLALRLDGVRVDRLLGPLFRSSIADEGLLDASLKLSGTPGDVLGLVGQGTLDLHEGRLWSIPVLRDLFRQLGFDKTGVFDRLFARFELRDGRIDVSHMELQSALLNLVGRGFQDFDGRLRYDLEVRYSLLDRLGIFSRLLYWLNNSLMRVAVRGDFARPRITVRNTILEVLGGGFDDTPDRHLPLPPFSELGRRF